jgi:hypothetical protein
MRMSLRDRHPWLSMVNIVTALVEEDHLEEIEGHPQTSLRLPDQHLQPKIRKGNVALMERVNQEPPRAQVNQPRLMVNYLDRSPMESLQLLEYLAILLASL